MADADKVHILEAVYDGNRAGEINKRCFSLRQDIKQLAEKLEAYPDCKLITIDPLSAYLEGIDSHNNSSVRSALTPLKEFAEARGVAVLCVMHLNKRGAGSILYRIQESIAFPGAARGTFVVAKDKNDAERRLLLSVKNNLSNVKTGFAYHIETAEDEYKSPYVVWEPDFVSMTAEEAFPEDTEDSSAVGEAKVWLLDVLKNGSVQTIKLQQYAQQAGLSWSSVRRAKNALKNKVGVIKQRQTGKWAWVLLAENQQGAQDNHAANVAHVAQNRQNTQGAQSMRREYVERVEHFEHVDRIKQMPVIERVCAKTGVSVDVFLNKLSSEDIQDLQDGSLSEEVLMAVAQMSKKAY